MVIKESKDVKYSEKYNPECEAMKKTYNFIYNEMVPAYGIKSNVVAVSGESIKRYTGYVTKPLGQGCKAIIMENNPKRFERLQAGLESALISLPKYKDSIKVVEGNIITYCDNKIVNEFIRTPSRFLDLGIGCGIVQLTEMARLMLFFQQKVLKHKKKKMVILDGARRKVLDINCIRALNNFLQPIGKTIESVNGISVADVTTGIFTKGFPYNNAVTIKGQPMMHSVTLSGNEKREVELTLFTYMNGSAMLTAVLQYK
jgi:hypothetical protein